MPQFHFYVSEEEAHQIRERAAEYKVSVSKYAAMIIKQDLPNDWPEGYFEAVVGGWQGEPLQRAPQPPLEDRDELLPG